MRYVSSLLGFCWGKGRTKSTFKWISYWLETFLLFWTKILGRDKSRSEGRPLTRPLRESHYVFWPTMSIRCTICLRESLALLSCYLHKLSVIITIVCRVYIYNCSLDVILNWWPTFYSKFWYIWKKQSLVILLYTLWFFIVQPSQNIMISTKGFLRTSFVIFHCLPANASLLMWAETSLAHCFVCQQTCLGS